MEAGILFVLSQAIVPISVIVIVCLCSNYKRNKETIKEQAGQIAYLKEENHRLREKLYMNYDPQKFKQEWQDEPEQPIHTGTQGRFSGGGF